MLTETNTWYPRFRRGKNIESTATPSFTFRMGPLTPKITSVSNSQTPKIEWKHPEDNAGSAELKKWGNSDITPNTYRIWVQNNDSIMLVGTVGDKETTFTVPLDKRLAPGSYSCMVEAVVGDSVLSSMSLPMQFNVPEEKEPSGSEITFYFTGNSDHFDTNTPEITWTITWGDEEEDTGTRSLTLIYGNGYVAGSVNDKRIELDATNKSYEFKDGLENQPYHWRLLARNKKNVVMYSEINTFAVNAPTAPKPVVGVNPANASYVNFRKGAPLNFTVIWQGMGWGEHANSGNMLTYEVTCAYASGDCKVAYESGTAENTVATLIITGPTDGAQVEWNVTANNSVNRSEPQTFSFTLCEVEATLKAPKFNMSAIVNNTSEPELVWLYDPPKTCDSETVATERGKTIVTLTRSISGDDKEIHHYEVAPDAASNATSFKIPETLTPGLWDVVLTAAEPGYAAVSTESPLTIRVCKDAPLQKPNITKFTNDINYKNVIINFTISLWPGSDYCNQSNTLKDIDLLTAYDDTTTSFPLEVNDVCDKVDATTYECSYTFTFDVVGTTYIVLMARSTSGASSYSDPYRAVLFAPTEIKGETDITLVGPEDGAFVAKDDAVLLWNPLTLGSIDSDDDSTERFVVTLTDSAGTAQTFTTGASSLDVSSRVTAGDMYTWSVRPIGSDSADNYTTSSFITYSEESPVLSNLNYSSPIAPFTVSWSNDWKTAFGSRYYAIYVDDVIVALVGHDEASYTFREDCAAFSHGVASTIKVVAHQDRLASEKSVTVTPYVYDTLVPPVLNEPADGSTVYASNDTCLSWALPDALGEIENENVTYELLLESADGCISISNVFERVTQFCDFDEDVESGTYYWTVRAVVAGRKSPFASRRSFVMNMDVNFTDEDSLDLYWPADGANVVAGSYIEFSWESLQFPEEAGKPLSEDRYELIITKDDDGSSKTYNVTPDQSSVYVSIKDVGTYNWTVYMYADDINVTASENRTLIIVDNSDDAKPQMPENSSVDRSSWPQTLTWDALSADEWGSGVCNSDNGTYPENYPERACTYMVYVGSNKTALRYIARTRNNSYTLQSPDIAIRGTYYWTVVADNGFAVSHDPKTGDCANFTGCTPLRPHKLTVVSPENSAFLDTLTVVFKFVALGDWGDTCGGDCCQDSEGSSERYNINLSYSYNSGNYLGTFERAQYTDEDGYSCINVTAPIGTCNWDITVTNKCGLTSAEAESKRSLSVCEPRGIVNPVLNNPLAVDNTTRMNTALIDGGKRGVKLSWKHYSTYKYGQICPYVSVTLMRLYFWLNDTAYGSKVISSTDNDYIMLPFPAMLERLELDRFERDVTVKFWLEASNSGVLVATSENVSIKTVSRDCDSVTCYHGACDEETLVCNCFTGYTGEDCSKESKKGGISDALKYSLIGLAIFLFIVIVVIVVIAVHYYSKHKKSSLRPPPNFEELRVPPIKRPNYIQNLSGNPDERLMEMVLSGDDSFQLVWAIFRAAGVTEADRLSKALLYFYQKQGKGLEFILFLVSREIAETSDASVLFRANSPATRAFKFYSKMIGLPYLFKTFAVMLQGIIRDINDAEEDLKEQKKLDEETAAGGGITLGEIDPENIDSRVGDENINVLTLQLLCQKFLLQIVRSDRNCPGELKHVCAFIKAQLEGKFPNAIYKGVGAFIFLRFYNTAITVPESYGLMESKFKLYKYIICMYNV